MGRPGSRPAVSLTVTARLAAAAVTARPAAALAVALAAALALLAGCSTAHGPLEAPGGRRVIQVVAAENFWGSIAAQLGGSHVRVVSIITNPSTDPHSYEPTAADARTIALARLVIENGIGYDPWVARLLAADDGVQSVLNVGSVLGVPADGNPHRWYSPADVRTVIARISADYSRLDPADRAYFARRRTYFTTVALRTYYSLIAAIRARYAGTPVGASESIFAMLAPALGLRLITPPSFLRAISEGTEVSAADKQTIDNQISRRLIKIYVYNSQNVTPDVRAQVVAARAAHIPVATITETMVPAAGTYQEWQVRQLRGIRAALIAAGAR
ncbi:MAG TPA: zinc ABC transporter substrate-binding protein [Streptosporangiaceae bacterium]|nr:zinc ABC transporter substrate-binding protein [Streptosporangiaceae bacterium]